MAEVHRVKDALSAKYGYDVRRLGQALQEAEKRRGAKYVSFGPRRWEPPGKAAGKKRRGKGGGKSKRAAKALGGKR